MTHNVPRPGSQSWHHVLYPGKDYRFKLISCPFQRSFYPISHESGSAANVCNDGDNLRVKAQLFPSVIEFHLWECAVDLRANVDYLSEANELFLYNQRKEARASKQCDDDAEDDDDADRNTLDDSSVDEEKSGSMIDFLNLLSPDGRQSLVHRFMSPMTSVVGTSLSTSAVRRRPI